MPSFDPKTESNCCTRRWHAGSRASRADMSHSAALSLDRAVVPAFVCTIEILVRETFVELPRLAIMT